MLKIVGALDSALMKLTRCEPLGVEEQYCESVKRCEVREQSANEPSPSANSPREVRNGRGATIGVCPENVAR
ncbi:unnamed protein product [Arctia plantaginis]|uniref:Uncharacterized protein n=1 Tax=Arctia plantaginis TaxID=874455 RepID=A0A8S1A1P4_ARCPL|nr:unnamed protein product [Arctia plantaginis]CAB3242033.1 unnamed protein product [Arctia plantaginis]